MFAKLCQIMLGAGTAPGTNRRSASVRVATEAAAIERLEDRQLLSAAGLARIKELQSTQVPERIARILNGTPTQEFTSVGMVGNATRNNCTGTLIGAQWVLTAAHCSTGVGDNDGRFTIGGQVYTTEKVIVHPNYRPRRFNSNKANDIALWKLSSPVQGIEPSPILRQVPQVGALLTLVGFGSGGDINGESGDYGTKRVGTTPLEKVTKTRLRWVFDSAEESNTGHGDSGGPAFIMVEGVAYVAGVTSGGTKFDASKGDRAFDTRVDVYQSWIDDVMNGVVGSASSKRLQQRLTRAGLATAGETPAGTVPGCGCDAVMADIMPYLDTAHA